MKEIDKEKETLRNKIFEMECKIVEMKCKIVAHDEQFDELGRVKQVPFNYINVFNLCFFGQ